MKDLKTILWVPAVLSSMGISASMIVNFVRGYKLNKRSDNRHKAVLNSINDSYKTLNSLNNSIKDKYKL